MSKNDNETITMAEKIRIQAKEEAEKEQPVKMTKAQKFLNKFDIFGDLFVLNIFFFLTSIPIITLGASLTALYSVTNKMVKNEEGPIRHAYMKAFKENFKQGTAMWLIDIIYIIFLVFQYNYYLSNDNQITKYLFIFMGFEFILMAFALPLQFPLLARYENTVPRTMLNALVLSLTNLSVWFRMFFIWMFPVALYYLRPNLIVYTWYLWGMILAALFAYVCSMFLVKFYDRMEHPETVQAAKKEAKTGK